MEKIDKSVRKSYPPLRLYLEDLMEIIDIFDANFNEYKIEVDDFKLDNIDEIDKINKKEINNLYISTFEGGFTSLNLNSFSASLKIDNEQDNKLLAVFHKIDKLLTGKEKFYLRVLATPNTTYIFSLGILIFALLLLSHKISLLLYILISLILICLMIVFLIVGYRIASKKYCIIYMVNSDSKIGFFEKNKDNIILSLFSTIFGGIIVVVITYILFGKP